MNNNFDQYGRPIRYYGEPPKAQIPVPPIQPEIKKTASARDMVFALICLVVSIVSVDFLLWAGAGIGISVCAALILLVSIVFLAGKGMKISFYSIVLSALYLSLSASLTFSDGGFLKFLALFLMATTYTVILIDTMSLRRFEGGTYKSVGDICYAFFALTFGKIGKTWYAVFHKKDGELIINRKTGSVFIGFALALPVLCVIIPLLASGDAAFEGLIAKITFKKIWEIIGAIVLGAFLFLLWFGQIFSSADAKRERAEEKPDRRGLEPTILSSFLAVISMAYLLYLFSQLAYFFNGFSGLLPEGFTNAEYARRGFFEMFAVCALNLIFVFVVMIVCRRKNGRAAVSVRILSAFLCVFSLVLIATSLSKMILYIDTYGMTRLRIFTSVFMVFLAVVFVSVMVRLFVKKMPYMKVALCSAAILVSLMCFFDVDGFIAKYNVRSYLDGRLDTIDVLALRSLSSDAVVPYLFELLEDENEDVVYKAKEALTDHAQDMFIIVHDHTNEKHSVKKEAYDFRRYNIHEYRARKMLMERFDEYYVEMFWYERG